MKRYILELARLPGGGGRVVFVQDELFLKKFVDADRIDVIIRM